MDKKIKGIILFWGIIFAFFLGVIFIYPPADRVLALEIHYPTIFGQALNDTSSFSEYACYLFGLLMNLAIIIAVIVIAFGGVYYLFSYGRGKFTNEGKEWIKAGVLGLLIAVCASLIAYTINPDLTTCKFGVLSIIDFNLPGNATPAPTGAGVATYKEIPIGTLTETLLARTMDCYGFDQGGNPVDGEQITADGNKKMAGPTYLDHDRADCLAQLVDGAQKKSQVIAALSDALTNLMNKCDCQKYGDCTNDCNNDGKGCDAYGGSCPLSPIPEDTTGLCPGKCVGAACSSKKVGDCCPAGVKNQIEHGPVSVSISVNANNVGSNSCKTPTSTYDGLDEFRCPVAGLKFQQCSGIPALVEKKVRVNNKTITLIDQNKWDQLNLTQQLTYFKEKIEEVKKTIQDDEDVLNQARTVLASPQCYLAMPYIDLLKTYESTDQKQRVILTDPEIFSDPETGNAIDASKYCQGFNYNNSECLKECNDICPDTSPQAIALYQSCGNCNSNDENCLSKQETCIENAYNSRPCIYGKNPSQKYGDCINSCQNNCTNNCGKKYLPCSDEYNFCKSQCGNNGQCVLDNAGSCLFDAGNFVNCANQVTDQGNTNYCINNAYLCKNGSDEYAGYSDCADPSQLTGKCSTYGYSASSFYDHPQCQKCPNPYNPPIKGSVCYSGTNTSASCQDLCPETTKCPSSSRCPNCPCDQISDPTDPTKPLNLKFSVPNTSVPDKKDKNYNAGNEGYYTSSQLISAHEIVGPQCNEYSYNDDPLTFYCQDNWWQDPNREGLSQTPMGTEKICPKEESVPVGQTVDDAENWANQLMDALDKINNKDIQPILDQMSKIGKAKDTSPIQDYCKCNAKLETNKPICTTGCQYSQEQVPVLDDNGDPTGAMVWQCGCGFVPCNGSPCQQIINYQSQLWNYYKQFKLDFIDFYTTTLKEPRSDIMKELTYSRKTTDNCSLVGGAYGSSDRLLSCTRVEDELISPINNGQIKFNNKTINAYCYGSKLGNLFGESLTDNWFCCQEWSKNPTTNNNPIYNEPTYNFQGF